MHKILAVDDEESIRKLITRILSSENGIEVEVAKSGEEALKKMGGSPDLLLLDINLPDIGGLTLLKEIRKINCSIPIVMLTGDHRIETAVKAIKAGAIDYIEKPFTGSVLRDRIEMIFKARGMPEDYDYGIVGSSPKIKKTIGLVNKFGLSDITILLQGETGVGKELFAKAIHNKSKRREGPFIPLDCATLSDNLFESELFGHEKGAFTGAIEKKIGKIERADGGTLFIDEVQNLSTSNQAKLLRVIQERELERVGGSKKIKVDARIVAATNLDIKEAVNNGKFRADFYYRLTQVVIEIPPLRERSGDIKKIVQHLLDKHLKEFGQECHISAEAMEMLISHDWPGNVRELENVIKSAAILGDGHVEQEHLPSYLTACQLSSPVDYVHSFAPSIWQSIETEVEKGFREASIDLKSLVNNCSDSLEEAIIQKVMKESNLNMSRAAKFLNIDPKTLRSKVQKINESKEKSVQRH